MTVALVHEPPGALTTERLDAHGPACARARAAAGLRPPGLDRHQAQHRLPLPGPHGDPRHGDGPAGGAQPHRVAGGARPRRAHHHCGRRGRVAQRRLDHGLGRRIRRPQLCLAGARVRGALSGSRVRPAGSELRGRGRVALLRAPLSTCARGGRVRCAADAFAAQNQHRRGRVTGAEEQLRHRARLGLRVSQIRPARAGTARRTDRGCLFFRPADYALLGGPWGIEGNPDASVGHNLLVAGENCVAVDTVAAMAMGFDPLALPYLRVAAARGLGPIEPQAIALAGDQMADVAATFRLRRRA